jgi:hypothetical protein
LNLQRSEYENRQVPYNQNLVYSFSTWIEEIENLKPKFRLKIICSKIYLFYFF